MKSESLKSWFNGKFWLYQIVCNALNLCETKKLNICGCGAWGKLNWMDRILQEHKTEFPSFNHLFRLFSGEKKVYCIMLPPVLYRTGMLPML